MIRVLGEIDLVGQSLDARQALDIGSMVFVEELEWIFVQVEQLRFAYFSVEHIPFDEFPWTFFDTPQPGFGATVVDTVEDIAKCFFFAPSGLV